MASDTATPQSSRRAAATGAYASGVARVGALAFALGLGGTFASSPGLAWADDGSPTPASAASGAADTEAADRDDAGDDAANDAGDGEAQEPVAEEEPVDEPADEPVEEPVDEPLDVEEPVEEPVDEPLDVEEPVEEPAAPAGSDAPGPVTPPATVTEQPQEEPEADEPAPDAATEDAAIEGAALTVAVEETEPDTTSTRTAEDLVTALTVPAAPFTGLSPRGALRDLQTQVTTCMCHLARRVVETVAAVVTAVAGAFGIVPGTPGATSGEPAAPADSPAMWGLLAWVRRQVDDFLATPQVRAFIATVSAETQRIWFRLTTCGQTLAIEDGFERTTVVSGLNAPTDFRFTPDGTQIWITEKGGAIRVVDDGVLRPDPLVVLPTLADVGERGLSGIEFHPDFDGQNGYVYVAYTNLRNHDVLTRLTITDGEYAGETVLVESTLPTGQIHHGGEIKFGPDGLLYWSVGDNGRSTNAQDLTNIHGKVLRMDPMTGAAPDPRFHDPNPTFDQPGAIEQIYAYGLRNPYRFTFTPDGQMLLADVGERSWEEINLITSGGNYGWPGAEGDCTVNCDGFIDPVYAYPHTPEPIRQGAITAVTLFTSDNFGSEYENTVFVADYSLKWIRVLRFNEDYSAVIGEDSFDNNAGTTVRLAEGPDGDLYQLTIYPGVLSRISVSDGNRAPTAVATATPANGLSPLTVQFSSAGSIDPERETLTYHWDFGDGTSSTEQNPTKTYATAESTTYTVTLTVSDGDKTGKTTTAVTVGNRAPVIAQIRTDAEGGRYDAGDTISFNAVVTDPDADPLSYRWRVIFHHADHIHPYLENVTTESGSVLITRDPHNGADTYYEIELTVTDRGGLSTTESVEVRPNLVDLTFEATPGNAVFTVDGRPVTGTVTEKAVVGVARELGAPASQIVDGQELVFAGWSDGGERTHTIITPGTAATYSVDYAPRTAVFEIVSALV
ncbi:PKD domain-containing protein [Mycobacterium sp. PS03-16]|uniref:PQQ-dependent sugar dehydrogenase n=1 Tax=Mycobacterium sp. PS03-16 TaxID=2559611 RepID=UPI0010739F27|nr:PQQ-dependent sugar dehydrogenase [Mycobacterium sp. PS03-16]TFV56684.1 PKD domain-containing protein [Mycobacterium sp. PS03-16]